MRSSCCLLFKRKSRCKTSGPQLWR